MHHGPWVNFTCLDLIATAGSWAGDWAGVADFESAGNLPEKASS